MPTTGPRPADIPFDHAAAAAAIGALEAARAVLHDTTGLREGAGHRARVEFRGAYAVDFGAADADLGLTTLDAFQALGDLRDAIAAAAEEARLAQAARDLEQDAWDLEAARPTPVGVA